VRLRKLQFGNVFTDLMVLIAHRDGAWLKGEVKAYGALPLDPAASALHYGQAIEGFEASAHPGGSVEAFRPEANEDSFNRSAKRLAMPEMPPELFCRQQAS
jgi:branched-chain amino acid aminotransferase